MITVIETPIYSVTLTSALTATLIGQPGPQGPQGPVGPDGSAALIAEIGNTGRDFTADYNTAKSS